VHDSRPAMILGRQSVRRRRECGCGYRFTTFEVMAGDLDAAVELREQTERLAKLARELAEAAGRVLGRAGATGAPDSGNATSGAAARG